MTTEVAGMEVVEMTDLIPFEDDGNAHLTHIVRPMDNEHVTEGQNMTGKDVVDWARLGGIEIVALCGYRWIPKFNPDKYPVCVTCINIAGEIIKGDG